MIKREGALCILFVPIRLKNSRSLMNVWLEIMKRAHAEYEKEYPVTSKEMNAKVLKYARQKIIRKLIKGGKNVFIN